MKKQLLSIAALLVASAAYSQVGINTETPQATLDIVAKNSTGTTTVPEGMLVPRVTRERAQNMAAVTKSTMIYVTEAVTGTQTLTAINIDAEGYYYFNGTAWMKMGSGGSGSGVNIYNADGTLTTDRMVTQGARTLAFTGTAANAFSVDGSTFSVDAANDRIGLGITSPWSRLTIVGTGGSDDDITIDSHSDTNTNEGNLRFWRSRGTHAAPTSAQSNDQLGALDFLAFDGTDYLRTAKISAVTNGTIGTGSVPTDINFTTGVNGSGTEKMRITSAGNVGISTNTPAATLDITAKASTGTSTEVDGMIVPRVTRQRAQSMSGITTSTMIYVTEAVTGTQTLTAINIDAEGYYYYNGTVWAKMGVASDINIYKDNGTLTNDRTVTQGARTLAFTGSAANAFSVDGNTFSVNASNDRIGIGTTTPVGRLEIVGSGGIEDDVFITSNSSTGTNSGQLNIRKSRGTNAAPTALSNGDNLGFIGFSGYDGSGYQGGNTLAAVVNGTVSAGNVPTDILISTSGAERMRVKSTGNIGIGTTNPTAALHTVSSTATNAFQMQDGSQANGKFLMSDATGKSTWVNSPLTSSVAGGNFTSVANFASGTLQPLGSITLTKGRWIVTWTLQLGLTGTTTFPKSYHTLSYLSSSNSTLSSTGFTVLTGPFGTLTGNIVDTNQTYLGQLRGASYIEVTATSLQLFVISSGINSGSLSGANVTFQGGYGENGIYAQPVF